MPPTGRPTTRHRPPTVWRAKAPWTSTSRRPRPIPHAEERRLTRRGLHRPRRGAGLDAELPEQELDLRGEVVDLLGNGLPADVTEAGVVVEHDRPARSARS